MRAEGVVRARIDAKLKKEVAAVLSRMGLSVSDAIRLMFVRIASEKALPFDVRVPNDETVAAMKDAMEGRVSRYASVSAMLEALDAEEEV
jgi:DNA-damage-inducible protein J